jgi:hypothetical protein
MACRGMTGERAVMNGNTDPCSVHVALFTDQRPPGHEQAHGSIHGEGMGSLDHRGRACEL